MTLLLWALLATLAGAHAQSTGSNAVSTPTPTPTQTETPAASTNRLPDLILTGITGLPSGHRAWVTIAESGQPSKSYALRLGQKLGDMEVREIDFRSGIVRVRYQGADVTLSFKTHSTLNEHVRSLVQSRDYVEQVRPFAVEHTRAHELRERREKERRDREREEVARAIAAEARSSGSNVATAP